MRSIKVVYRVRPDYIEENKANITRVMQDLRKSPIKGLYYAAYDLGDGRFMHMNVVQTDEALERFNERPAFVQFRTALAQSKPIEPPFAEEVERVGANVDPA